MGGVLAKIRGKSDTFEPDPPTQLHRFVTQHNWDDVITRLQTHPVEAEICNHKGFTALHIAVTRRPPSNVIHALLLVHPLAAQTKTARDGRTPLHLACYSFVPADVVLALVLTNPEACVMLDSYGWNPLHICARFNTSQDIIRILVNKNPAALSMKDHSGKTPLHIACDYFGVASVEQFNLILGGDLNCIDEEDDAGHTPIEILCMEYDGTVKRGFRANNRNNISIRPNVDISHLLVDELAIFWDKANFLIMAAHQGSIGIPPTSSTWKMVHACVGMGYFCPSILALFALQVHPHQVKQRDANGNLPLHIAASLGSSRHDILRTLIDLYPDAAKTPNREGKFPLHLAHESNTIWEDGFREIFCTYPPALESIGVVDELYPFILSRVGNDSNLDGFYRILRERPNLLSMSFQ